MEITVPQQEDLSLSASLSPMIEEEGLNTVLHLLEEVEGGHAVNPTTYTHPVMLRLVEFTQ
jgi:hypothetical protein